MTRPILAFVLAAFLSGAAGYALDLPIRLGFQLGFAVHVVPAKNDMSHLLGLGVVADRILTDKTRSLTVTGFITNYNDVPCEDVAMRFAVTSYVGIGTSLGTAAVEPRTIPPGGTSRFTLRLSLDSERPRLAMYAITAKSPVVAAPAAVAGPCPAPEYAVIGETPEIAEEIPAQ